MKHFMVFRVHVQYNSNKWCNAMGHTSFSKFFSNISSSFSRAKALFLSILFFASINIKFSRSRIFFWYSNSNFLWYDTRSSSFSSVSSYFFSTSVNWEINDNLVIWKRDDRSYLLKFCARVNLSPKFSNNFKGSEIYCVWNW